MYFLQQQLSDTDTHETNCWLCILFVANRNNYSRWAPLYLLDMLQLPDYAEDAFMRGNFSVRRARGKFNGIWSDMGTETTAIRDAKGDSGIIGLTRKQPADNLACTHEEADTRMPLHAVDADLKFQDTDGRIIIKTPDTYVVVLAVYYFPQMKHVSEFWIETGRVTRTADLRCFIPVHEICKSLGPSFCTILPAVHALFGTD